MGTLASGAYKMQIAALEANNKKMMKWITSKKPNNGDGSGDYFGE